MSQVNVLAAKHKVMMAVTMVVAQHRMIINTQDHYNERSNAENVSRALVYTPESLILHQQHVAVCPAYTPKLMNKSPCQTFCPNR